MAAPSKSPSEMAAPDYQPRRGRPTSDQTIAIEEQLVSTARRLFLEQGYARTSMQAIATVARVGKGTLYARYPTKSHLFRAIVEDRFSAWQGYNSLAETAVEDGADIETRLLRRAIYILKGMRLPEIQAFDRLIFAEAKSFPELGRFFDERGYNIILAETAADLEAEGRGDNEPTRNSIGVATIFQQALLGWIRSQGSNREVSDDECEIFARQLVALCLRGRGAW
jgi:TetR/AcrR family transcriptional repressor of mexJK operon